MPDSPSFETLSVEPVSTVDRVVEELRRALFEGDLEPGTPLREVALAGSLGVSRSTVREAVGMLVADGLVDRIPNKGTSVHALTADGIRDICRARLVLETAGVDGWADASDEARDVVRAANAAYGRLVRTKASAQELTAAHLEIHRSLTALTGSPRLIAMSETLYAEIRLALAHLDRARGNTREQAHAHSDLLELLEAGRLTEARASLVEHLAGAERSLLESVDP
ncbi:GntR family transcriptional regulator [Nocardioides marmorisolisilvae]|uniref:GntR family transcriptional regulator n=1 Tax=Nocardioides marmorisolisilvae TaxID=1542737 RepID=A0A3N0DQ28_9ACTN|nr:GntR family transcriptional regulator [Nocardioides marmorisolisilvae]RNL77754.1 GntR family transcriptional regulator [Nocardioides marmorisolisilvae]